MKSAAVLIAAGYGLLVWEFGGWGLLAAVAHVGVLLLTVGRR